MEYDWWFLFGHLGYDPPSLEQLRVRVAPQVGTL